MEKSGAFLFLIPFIVPDFIVPILYYAIQITDDVISGSNMGPKHKINNISSNNKAMLLKLVTGIVPKNIHHMVHILMLLWQHPWFQISFIQNKNPCFSSFSSLIRFQNLYREVQRNKDIIYVWDRTMYFFSLQSYKW